MVIQQSYDSKSNCLISFFSLNNQLHSEAHVKKKKEETTFYLCYGSLTKVEYTIKYNIQVDLWLPHKNYFKKRLIIVCQNAITLNLLYRGVLLVQLHGNLINIFVSKQIQSNLRHTTIVSILIFQIIKHRLSYHVYATAFLLANPKRDIQCEEQTNHYINIFSWLLLHDKRYVNGS